MLCLGTAWGPPPQLPGKWKLAPAPRLDHQDCAVNGKATMHSFACSSSNIHHPHSWKAGSKPPRLFHYTKPSAAHPDHQRRILVTASTQENDTQREVDDNAADSAPPNMLPSRPQKSRRQADSTDWVSSQLTRRFGIAGGLVWLGVLAFGVISEQIKTRIEDSAERENTKDVKEEKVVVTRSGLKYVDKRIGGGAPVQPRLLMILDYRATANGQVFEDTKQRGKPIVFTYGTRPFTGGMCKGTEEALATMKAGGVRKVIVPPELGFGESGYVLRPTEHVPEKQGVVPPGATLEYELSVLRVSIPPS